MVQSSPVIAQPTRLAEVTLNGYIDDGTGNPITNGKLFIKLNGPVIEIVNGVEHVRYPMEATPILVTNGTFTAKLVPSEEVTYNFRLAYIHPIVRYLLADGTPWNGAYHKHSDGLFYTGKTHTAQSRLLTEDHFDELRDIANFDAHVLPSYGDPINWSQLVNSGISAKNVDSSILYLAHLLKADPTFASTVANGVVRFKGPYNASSKYNYGDEVSYHGDKWIYLGTNGGNSEPKDGDTNWLKVTGTGQATTGLINDPIANWDGVIDKAPTADQLHDLLITLAPLKDPTFSGSVAVPDIQVGSTGLAVNDRILAQFVTAALSNLPAATPIPVNIIWVTESFPQGDPGPALTQGWNTRNLEFKNYDWINDATIVPPTVTLKGGKWFLLGFATSHNCERHTVAIKRSDTGNVISKGISGYQTPTSAANQNALDVCVAALNITAPTPLQLVSWADSATPGSMTRGKPANATGQLETYAGLFLVKIGVGS